MYFLLHFHNLKELLNILKKKMTLIAYVFPKYLVKKIFQDSFKTQFNNHHAKVSEKLFKSAWHHLCDTFSSLWGKRSCKISLLVISEILALFVSCQSQVFSL